MAEPIIEPVFGGLKLIFLDISDDFSVAQVLLPLKFR